MGKLKSSIIGLIRVWKESHIIQETLDHLSEFCNGGILVYDDCSTDETQGTCDNHKNVKEVMRASYWDNDRARAEFENCQSLLSRAKEFADKKDWFVYLEADERIEFDWNMTNKFDETGVFPAHAYKLKETLYLYTLDLI